MAELLLELLSEEIPARMQPAAGRALSVVLGLILRENAIGFAAVQSYTTPRRLTVVATGVALEQDTRTHEKRGPRLGAPQAAIDGFLKGIPSGFYRLEERDEPKGKVLFAVYEMPGRRLSDIVSDTLPNRLAEFPWTKSMRWGDLPVRWVRPLVSILCLLDGEIVPLSFAGVNSSNLTRGHRFAASEPFQVSNFAEYRDGLQRHKVEIDATQRWAKITSDAETTARSRGYWTHADDELYWEISGLVEWPICLVGVIDPDFMKLPTEVLTTSMRSHQRYIPLVDGSGQLAPAFVLVANALASDGGAAIVAGNERVLRARLWDAKFFWDQDRKASLESRLSKFDQMVFHAELGTQGQRVERLVALAGAFIPHVPGSDRILAERAALLAKADLVTGMVGEFPELQGVMGGHYAAAQGEPPRVALAIREHYGPKGPDDQCPTAPESVVVALADKLDLLVGFFAAGIRPTGTKDPFALRRAGLGVIRLVFENGLRLPLQPLIGAAKAGYGDRFAGFEPQQLIAFLADRLKVHLREKGVRHDLIAAAFAVGDEDDLLRLAARAEALQSFIDSEDGRNLLTAFRRAANIVAIEEKKDGRRYDGHPVVGLLAEPEEEALFAALEASGGQINTAIWAEDYAAAMAVLASLRQPLDEYFAAVMVNAPEPDLRLNRLLLLARIRSALERVADFSLIEDAPRRESAA